MKTTKKFPAHDSVLGHVTGQSEFIDDRPMLRNELHVGLILSPRAHARFLIKNLNEVLAMEGVEGIFLAKDFAHNCWGTIFQDQPLLADKLVQYAGEVVAIVATSSDLALKRAKAAFQVEYKDLPAILSIAEARKKKSFIGSARKILRGDPKKVLKTAKNILQDSLTIAGAEHFYLEPQCCVAYPGEMGRLEIHSSCQHPTEVQHVISHALNLESKDVVVITKRMGGAFGGKESQSAPIAAYAALVAAKLNRPARLVLEREEDMLATGKRNPFYNEYRVAYDAKGKILALEMDLYSDAGAYADLSTSIMERAMLHCDNAYHIPHLLVRGQVCRTNYHPHTAFRGFGGAKAMLAVERVIEEIAYVLGRDALDVRKLNCYQGNQQRTHYGQKVENNMLPDLFAACEKSSAYRKRRKQIDVFNAKSISSKGEFLRGLSMTPVKFGISFTTRFLNQGNALLNVYRDGSVQVSTGATEMGQGVYRKISQIVADELGLPFEKLRVMPTSTEKNANTSPTAASSGADINGAAAALAAQRIKARLSSLAVKLLKLPRSEWASVTAALGTAEEVEVPLISTLQPLHEKSEFFNVCFEKSQVFLKSAPKKRISFAELCNEAYLNRISLSEYAHYKFPGLSFDKIRGKGNAFLYFTQGVAASEVQIDRLSGEMKVLACDIQMDLGRPLNPGIDQGQICGAFVQGMGWLTMERLHYDSQGLLKSLGPSTYKIPSVHDIPRNWNVDLFKNETNKVNVRASKAVGEPPLLLAISVWTAIQNALSYEARFRSAKEYPRLDVPAHAEAILLKGARALPVLQTG